MNHPPPLPPPTLQSPPDDRTTVYLAAPGTGRKATLLFVGAAALVLFSVVGFLLSLRLPNDNLFRFHSITTLPMILAVSCVSGALAVRRSPREVRVGPGGVTIAFQSGTRDIPWDAIALAATADAGTSGRKVLKLFGGDGRAVVTIGSAVIGFEAMVADVRARLAARPHAQTAAVATKRSRKQAVFLVIGGFVAMALAAANGYAAYDDARDARLMRESAVAGEAIVVRKFVAPDGRTHRIEYQVMGVAGAPLENVEYNRLLWAAVSEGQRLPVRYVPSDPDISRLEIGQTDDAPRSPTMVRLTVFVSLLGMLLFVDGVLKWRRSGRAAPVT